ncbi:MAG TPA: hypothetical protein VIW24_07335 [Aldersonia sp.]
MAPQCEEYWATDLSAAAVAKLRHNLDAVAAPWTKRVQVAAQRAHVADGLPPNRFDVIVLN